MNLLFRKIELRFALELSKEKRQLITKAILPLSKKNVLTLKKDDFKQALEELSLKPEIKSFLVNYLANNIQDMI